MMRLRVKKNVHLKYSVVHKNSRIDEENAEKNINNNEKKLIIALTNYELFHLRLGPCLPIVLEGLSAAASSKWEII